MSSDISSSSSSRSSSVPVPYSTGTVDEPVARTEPCSAFASDTIPGSLTPDELSLIRIQYGVPPEYELELPGPSDRASAPPPGRFCLYQEAFRAELQLPLPSFIVALFRFL